MQACRTESIQVTIDGVRKPFCPVLKGGVPEEADITIIDYTFKNIPNDVLTLGLAGSDPFAVPSLVVETSLDGVAWTRVPGDFDPLPDARALVAHPRDTVMALVLPTAVEARFLRLACDRLEWRVRDLQVYAE